MSPLRTRRLQFGLRTVAGALVVVAVLLAAVRPFLREAIDWAQRQAWVYYIQADSRKHLDQGRSAAERFVDKIEKGHIEQAYAETGLGFHQRLGLQAFAEFITARPILRGPYSLTYGVIRHEGPGIYSRLISEYQFLVGIEGSQKVVVKVLLATERGIVRVDEIKVTEP